MCFCCAFLYTNAATKIGELFYIISSSNGVHLNIEDVTLKQGEIRTSTLSIGLTDVEALAYAGIQFDMLLPQGIELVSVAKGAALAQYDVRSKQLTNGNVRIIAFGNGAEVVEELNDVLFLTFQGTDKVSPGDYACTVSNVYLSDPLGQDIFGSDSEFYIHLLADNTSDSSQIPDVNNPDAEPNPSEIPTASDDRNSEGWYGNFNGTYVSEYRIREGNTLGMMVETPDGGYKDEWDFLWKDSEGNVLGEEQVIYTPALLFSGDYSEDYQIRRARDYNVTLTSYGPEDNVWAKTTLYTTPVYIYKRPALPRQLLRKGDGTSCTFVVMMNGLTDENLAQLGYSFVYGYYDFEGKAQILDTTALRYTHTTSEIYNDPSNRFWVYSQWPYADGSIVSSGLLFLDGTTDETFDASIFGNGQQQIIRDIDNQSIYSLDGRYLGTDESNLEPGIYICNGKKFIKR